jgi:hypothetical protein
VTFADEEEDIVVEDIEEEAEEETLMGEVEPLVQESASDGGTKTAARRPRKVTHGGAQKARQVPVKLRAEAEPGKMVDKILNQNIDGIMVRDVLGLSPDLLRELWGVKRFPAVKATIPATKSIPPS